MKGIHSLDNLYGKKVFLRADLNVPFIDGVVSDSTRITRVIPTIDFLRNKGAIIIIASHFARPGGRVNPSMSLINIVPKLEECLNQKVVFLDDCIGPQIQSKLQNLAPGSIVLLENLRFYPEEGKNDLGFARQLASLADLYVNDAFSCAHREHASIVGITRFLPSYAGLLMEREIINLDSVIEAKERPSTAIIGGRKVSTKFKVLNFLANKVDHLIITGGMANTFAKAQGYEIGASYCEDSYLEEAKAFMNKSFRAKIFIPTDFAVLDLETEQVELLENTQLKTSSQICDIGTTAVLEICDIIAASKILLWNGPIGLFEDKRFSVSTFFIARFIAKLTSNHKLNSIIGGGDVVAAVQQAGVANIMTYISTAGGAFLEYFENGVLHGITALMEADNNRENS